MLAACVLKVSSSLDLRKVVTATNDSRFPELSEGPAGYCLGPARTVETSDPATSQYGDYCDMMALRWHLSQALVEYHHVLMQGTSCVQVPEQQQNVLQCLTSKMCSDLAGLSPVIQTPLCQLQYRSRLWKEHHVWILL